MASAAVGALLQRPLPVHVLEPWQGGWVSSLHLGPPPPPGASCHPAEAGLGETRATCTATRGPLPPPWGMRAVAGCFPGSPKAFTNKRQGTGCCSPDNCCRTAGLGNGDATPGGLHFTEFQLGAVVPPEALVGLWTGVLSLPLTGKEGQEVGG